MFFLWSASDTWADTSNTSNTITRKNILIACIYIELSGLSCIFSSIISFHSHNTDPKEMVILSYFINGRMKVKRWKRRTPGLPPRKGRPRVRTHVCPVHVRLLYLSRRKHKDALTPAWQYWCFRTLNPSSLLSYPPGLLWVPGFHLPAAESLISQLFKTLPTNLKQWVTFCSVRMSSWSFSMYSLKSLQVLRTGFQVSISGFHG